LATQQVDGAQWSCQYTRENKFGVEKRVYNCKGKKCPKTGYLLLHDDHQGTTFFISVGEHSHDAGDEFGLPRETISLCEQMMEEGNFKPCRIQRRIAELGLPQISDKQLSNWKSRYMLTKFDNLSLQKN
jgi:hypothetical protein